MVETFRKKISKMGKHRRIIEVPKEYHDEFNVGDKVKVTKKETKVKK